MRKKENEILKFKVIILITKFYTFYLTYNSLYINTTLMKNTKNPDFRNIVFCSFPPQTKYIFVALIKSLKEFITRHKL